MNRSYLRESVVILTGTALIVLGDFLLGVRIEFFHGMATFTPYWILDIFLVPFVAGYAVAKMYGEKGGKWLACAPPLIARILSVLHLYFTNPQWNADLFYYLHLHYWGLSVILAVEAANLGGVLGEFQLGAYLRNDAMLRNKEQG